MKRADNQSAMSGGRKVGFLRIPNEVLNDLYSDWPDRRQKARVYLCLLRHAYFVDGEITVNKQKMRCRKGEWVTTLRQLEQKTDVPRSNIGALLDQLAADGSIISRRDGQFTFVKLLGEDKPKTSSAASAAVSSSEPAFSELPVVKPNYKRFKDESL